MSNIRYGSTSRLPDSAESSGTRHARGGLGHGTRQNRLALGMPAAALGMAPGDGIALHLEGMAEDGEAIPPPGVQVDYVEVPAA